MGIVKHYPKRRVAIPKQPSKHHRLSLSAKRRNRRLANLRTQERLAQAAA